NYQVQATWNADGNHATNASFSIYDGTTLLQTVLVDERPTPSGPTDGGVTFQGLATVHIGSGTLRVVLSDAGDGYIVADAVRLVPVIGPAEIARPVGDSSATRPGAHPTPFNFGGTNPIGSRPFDPASRGPDAPAAPKAAGPRTSPLLPSFSAIQAPPASTPFARERSGGDQTSLADPPEPPFLALASNEIESSLQLLSPKRR